MIGEGDTKLGKAGFVNEQALPSRVSEIQQASASSEAGRELLYHSLLYLVVPSGRKPKVPAVGQRDRNHVAFASAPVAFGEGASFTTESGCRNVPPARSVTTHGPQGGFRDGVMAARTVRWKVCFEGIVVGDPALTNWWSTWRRNVSRVFGA